MTENEAIKILVTEKYCLDKSTKGLCKINCGDCKENISIAYQEKAYEMAISALKKIQQYQEIGSVEECREAIEKQKPKKPVLRNDNGKLRKSCPVCGCFFSPLSRSCPKCGQAILQENKDD